MKKISYFLIIFAWTFILIGHSKAETRKPGVVFNNDKLVYPIFYLDIQKLINKEIKNIQKLINKEIEETKKYQKKIWKKEKTQLSGFFYRFPDR